MESNRACEGTSCRGKLGSCVLLLLLYQCQQSLYSSAEPLAIFGVRNPFNRRRRASGLRSRSLFSPPTSQVSALQPPLFVASNRTLHPHFSLESRAPPSPWSDPLLYDFSGPPSLALPEPPPSPSSKNHSVSPLHSPVRAPLTTSQSLAARTPLHHLIKPPFAPRRAPSSTCAYEVYIKGEEPSRRDWGGDTRIGEEMEMSEEEVSCCSRLGRAELVGTGEGGRS